MKKNFRKAPTQQYLHDTYIYDPYTGIFTRKVDKKRWKAGSVCGSKSLDGYINISVDGLIFRAHRLAWVYMTGEDPAFPIDHINQAKTDNRWENLRRASQSKNMMNGRVRKNTKSGVKGVYPARGRFAAKVMRDGRSYHLGTFDTISEASAAYNTGAKLLHGDFFSPSVLGAEPSCK